MITALLTAYAAYLQPEWFTLEAYLWAVELWYAYAIQVTSSRQSSTHTGLPWHGSSIRLIWDMRSWFLAAAWCMPVYRCNLFWL